MHCALSISKPAGTVFPFNHISIDSCKFKTVTVPHNCKANIFFLCLPGEIEMTRRWHFLLIINLASVAGMHWYHPSHDQKWLCTDYKGRSVYSLRGVHNSVIKRRNIKQRVILGECFYLWLLKDSVIRLSIFFNIFYFYFMRKKFDGILRKCCQVL